MSPLPELGGRGLLSQVRKCNTVLTAFEFHMRTGGEYLN